MPHYASFWDVATSISDGIIAILNLIAELRCRGEAIQGVSKRERVVIVEICIMIVLTRRWRRGQTRRWWWWRGIWTSR